MEGVWLIDKAAGFSSFAAAQTLRLALGAQKVGHTGTLDPLATGLLVVLTGRYTRLNPYLVCQEKVYHAHIWFGQSTTTDDAEGQILSEVALSKGQINEEMLKETLVKFEGSQYQSPPAFSAISINGERAYRKARRGEEVSLPLRQVHIEAIELLRWSFPIAEIKLTCSAGTYVRAVARDVGKALSLPAHLSGLRRLRVGPYDVADAIPQSELESLKKSLDKLHHPLLQKRVALKGIEQIEISPAQAKELKQGRQLVWPGALKQALACLESEPIAMVAWQDGRLRVLRGF